MSMRFCNHELGKAVQLKDGEMGRLTDFIVASNDFTIREVKVHTGIWPFTKDYSLPPELVNFLKSDSEHVFLDLSEEELKTRYKEPPKQRSDARTDFFAFEEPWGIPYSWSREDSITFGHEAEGPITGYETESYDEPHDLITLYSLAALCRSELALRDESIAKVVDVLIEPVRMQARYVVCQGFTSGQKTLLLPLEWLSTIDLENYRVAASNISETDFNTAPDFNSGDVVNTEAEDELCKHYGKTLSWIDPTRRYRQKSGDSPELRPFP